VHFKNSGVACLGGILYSDNFCFSDLNRGANVKRLVKNLDVVIELLPADSKLIPAHGRNYTIEELKEYRAVISKTTKIIEQAIQEGKTLEEIRNANLLQEWDSWGKGTVSTALWTNLVFNHVMSEKRPQKTSICVPVTKTFVNDGIEIAIKKYRNIKKMQPDEYDFGEAQLNMLGYQLIFRNMITEAIEIFKLNVEMYPKAFNAYDSLGEGFMTNGDNELAIKNYKKSLELNPNNNNAVQKLEELLEEK